jgi:hypothetical protein
MKNNVLKEGITHMRVVNLKSCHFFLIFISCHPSPVSSTKNTENLLEKESLLGASKSLKIKNFKISIVEEGGNKYPKIEFQKDPSSDYTKYSFCSKNNECTSDITLDSEVTYYEELGDNFSASARPCVFIESASKKEESCGLESSLKGSIDQGKNSSEASLLVQKKEGFVNLLRSSGLDFLRVVEKYRGDFSSCASENPTANLLVSDEDYKKMSTMDPMLLGEAIYLLIEDLTNGSSIGEEGEYNGTSDIVNLIFGITGLAAGVSVIIDTFSNQTKANEEILKELKTIKSKGESVTQKDISDISEKFKNSNFEARIKDLDVNSVNSKAKFTDLSMGDKFKVIGVGAVGASLFTAMTALSVSNMSEGYGLTSEEELCSVEKTFLKELQDLGSKITIIIDKIKEIEIELLVMPPSE